MRVTEVAVQRLFHTFDHTILLNQDEHITIIHGPNGFGKTALLRMLNAVLSGQYQPLLSLPFATFRVTFDDSSSLSVERTEKNNVVELIASLYVGTKKRHSCSLINDFDHRFDGLRRDRRDRYSMELEYMRSRLGPDEFHIAVRDLYDQLSLTERQYLKLHSDEEKGRDKWLRELQKQVSVGFIETQRLLHLSSQDRPKDMEGTGPLAKVALYSRELAAAIQTKLAEYAARSQQLDRTFPSRVVALGAKDSVMGVNDLKARFSALAIKRRKLRDVGLLDRDTEMDFQLDADIKEPMRSVLSVYVQDVEDKLSVFDDIASKIDLFAGIINNRFRYKRVVIDKDGFHFVADAGQRLAPSSLSSGEQHELVLGYELLFRVKPGSLILIDEPELSLHIAWQKQFLRDLQKITTLTSFDVLIATHSPQIIHNRWDLTVELKGNPK